MKKLSISKLIMKGFKNHEDLVEFDLGTLTNVSGANGTGKTTIGEAISWALIGSDLVGNERATTRLVNDKCKDVYVELQFTFKEEEHVLIRRRKGSTMSISLDDKTVKQTDLVNFYHSKELFLSIFSPTYFPGLTPKLAKEVLDSVLGEVSKEEVYKALPKKIVDTLTKSGFGNPNMYLENQRERAKEIQEDIHHWNGFKEGKAEDIEIPEIIKFDAEPLTKLREQLEAINNQTVTQLHDITDLMSKRDKLRVELNTIENESQRLFKSEPTLIDVSKLSAEIASLRESYKTKLDYVKNLSNIVSCPNCKEVIDLDEDAKNKVLAELEALRVKGTELSNNLADAVKGNAQIEKEYDEQRTGLMMGLKEQAEKLEAEIDNLNVKKLEEENLTHTSKQKITIGGEREILNADIGALLEEEQNAKINNSKRDDLLKRKEETEARIEEATSNIKELGEEQVQIKLNTDYAKQFVSKRLDIQSKQLKEHLNKVTIQLERVTNDGEVIPDFKILYDSKEFAILSNSERIKAGLEIANLLMNVSGLYAPIFVDNAESITEIPRLRTQVIEARVKEDTELLVEVIE